LFGQPLLTKPPGFYVAVALISAPFGVSEWTARLPSALAASAMVALFYWYFARTLGPRGGFVAALLLPLNGFWIEKTPAAEIEMLHVFWVTASILFLLRALDDDKPLIHWWLAALLCVAGGFLTKWTAPVFFYGTALPLLWCRGQLRVLASPAHLISAGIGAVLCLGWAALAVAEVGWGVFSHTITQEAIPRLSPAHHHASDGAVLPLWLETILHPLWVVTASLPVSGIALLTLRPGFGALLDERQRRLVQALHCWLWPNLLFWSLVPEHGLRHTMPLTPAFAGLAAMAFLVRLDGLAGNRFLARSGLVGLVLLGIAVKIVFVDVIIPRRDPNRSPAAKGQRLAELVPSEQTLYVGGPGNESTLFYFSRLRTPPRRIDDPDRLLWLPEPVFCTLNAIRGRNWLSEGKADLIESLTDERGEPLLLLRTRPVGRMAREGVER
jgi:4-amino-4-deoxy-L-arabinose transferase-like glycosyltransferase